MLKDGRKVIAGSDEIIAHLPRAGYPAPDDAEGHAEVGRFRVVLELDESPEEALALLREAFATTDIRIVCETRGFEARRRPAARRLRARCTPRSSGALEQAVAVDPTAPAATNFCSLPCSAVDGGSAIAVTRPFRRSVALRRPGPEHAHHGGDPAGSTRRWASSERSWAVENDCVARLGRRSTSSSPLRQA